MKCVVEKKFSLIEYLENKKIYIFKINCMQSF